MNDLNFRKSSYSGNRQDCVEIADTPDGAAIRDTKNRVLGHLAVDSAEWNAFLSRVKHDLT